MALDQSALLEASEALRAADVDDRIRTAAQTIYQALIEAELTAVIGAEPHERTDDRLAQRNGHRPKVLTTTAGELELQIPKLRVGSFFPSLLERRRRIDQALFAVVMEAYLHGVSTRKVDDLVRALGADTGISKSEVSRICKDLDAEVGVFRDRSLAEQPFPYVFLDATYCRARVNRRVVSQAVVVATGVAADGRREVLGFGVGDSEDGAFWTAFLRTFKARGLAGVQLVISDAHVGLRQQQAYYISLSRVRRFSYWQQPPKGPRASMIGFGAGGVLEAGVLQYFLDRHAYRQAVAAPWCVELLFDPNSGLRLLCPLGHMPEAALSRVRMRMEYAGAQ